MSITLVQTVNPPALRSPRHVKEHEVLRVSAALLGDDQGEALRASRNQVLRWAKNKTPGLLPAEAWQHDSFEHFSSGRSCAAVRVTSHDADIWSLRVEDPDKTVAGRVWTTEITISNLAEGTGTFALRSLVGSPEPNLDIEPHVPGVVRQVIQSPGLSAGRYRLTDKGRKIGSEAHAELLIDALLDPRRKLPIIVLSVPAASTFPDRPLLDARMLAEACAGLAIVIILPSAYSWALTERLGKQLSVYEGAVRIYLPGFTEDANPFGGHDLILSERFSSPAGAAITQTRLRRIVASGSVRRLQLGTDIWAFASLKARALEKKQLELQHVGATDREQLGAANRRIRILEEQLAESERYQTQFSDLHSEAEERAKTAEVQHRAAGFRIQQLLEQITASGTLPDANIALPDNWEAFGDWCDAHLAGRVILTPQARREVRSPEFEEIDVASKCLLWLANDYRVAKTEGAEGSLREKVILAGVRNAHCGSDAFEVEWQGHKHSVDWHIKNGGNTRDPARCLRIYYFWDDFSQQAVVASMPAHRRTDAS
jgi:hypothetical protein